ncbi:MAG: hypothetical protein CMH55_09140 [Myxococcales bacterium]|nr:hypothetical protein [Myxococcales bacterium]
MLLVASGDAAPVEEEKPGIVALDLVAVTGVKKGVARLLNEAMLSRLKASKRFSNVLGSSDFKAMLTLEQQKAALGCDDDSCLAELGGALGVPFLFGADVGVVGGRFLLNVKILRVDEATVADRRTTIYGSEGELLEGLDAAVDAVVLGALGPEQPAPAPVADGSKKQLKTKARPPWLGLSTLIVGAGLSAGGWIYFSGEQDQFNTVEDRRINDFERLDEAETVANTMLGLGAAVMVLGGILLW